MSKRIIIMTASIGYGHDQAAENLKRAIAAIDCTAEIEIIDFMKLLHPTISQFIISTYLRMIDLFPSGYHFLYHMTKKLNTQNKVSDLISYRYKKKIAHMVTAKQIDMIVFTNPFASVLVSSMKKKGKLNLPTATIITDYTAHPVWLDETMDMYFVACDELKQELIESGISPYRIFVSGIPIHEKFDLPVDKNEVIREQDLDPHLPTLLVMGGGLGLGPIKEILDAIGRINAPLQLLVVAGKNSQLKQELENKRYNSLHKVRIYGFCNNINELMGVSHLLISKSGGLTMTEAISKGLPTIIVDPIPGQEVINARYFSGIGAARMVEEPEDLKANIEDLLFYNPDKRNEMLLVARAAAKPRASGSIALRLLDHLKSYNKHKASIN